MDGFNDSVMMAFLPVDGSWSKLELPHMTLVYAGKISDRKISDFNAMAKDASTLAQLGHPFSLVVMGKVQFGGNGDDEVDVFRLISTPELQAQRAFVERWNKLEHPFRPHVTIGPVGSFVEFEPRTVMFDKIAVAWGDDQITFNL